jgi:hypothetical protein
MILPDLEDSPELSALRQSETASKLQDGQYPTPGKLLIADVCRPPLSQRTHPLTPKRDLSNL